MRPFARLFIGWAFLTFACTATVGLIITKAPWTEVEALIVGSWAIAGALLTEEK